ncbi:ACT domain-containing protein [Qingshengfaniella alkalisoli]|uniref:ACT domain-containing protein n=1 Tax=Qingshengfaniella alkalisoli TaxID=2599296 RepID=A0A5B8J008_9RHOB|nr:ACT domain-containing protein [Qingshengfaniella alkalisoli]
MISGMSPRLVEGTFCFVTAADDAGLSRLLPDAKAMFREGEGLSLIMPARMGDDPVFSQITLDVHSALDGIGLTAAVSTLLAGAGIPCNVVVAHHHDHAFVPIDQAASALTVLEELASG